MTARKRYAIVANGGYCRMLLDAIDQKFKNDAELIAFAPWEGERLTVTGTKGQAEYFRPNAEPDEFWPAPLVT